MTNAHAPTRPGDGAFAPFLECSPEIDWDQPAVLALARELGAAGRDDPRRVAEACFLFVRDQIRHSIDYNLAPVTCRASRVLAETSGLCYAKSHLLAALLRANRIPAGLCYQRLVLAAGSPQCCLHGLNALYLPDLGWFRVDARGNKPGVDARFAPPREILAFPLVTPEERDFPWIFSRPLPDLVGALNRGETLDQLLPHLPDRATLSPADGGPDNVCLALPATPTGLFGETQPCV